MKKIVAIALVCGIFYACQKKTDEPAETPLPTVPSKIYPDTAWTPTGSGARLIFKFKFDSTQARLDNLGNPSPALPSGRAAYSPVFNWMGAHYIELGAGDHTALGAGQILYLAPETTTGSSSAIDFGQSVIVREGVTFFSMPLHTIAPGTYKWLRLSLSYQNYTIAYKASALTTPNHVGYGTVASFLGFQTYVQKYRIKDQDMVPSSFVGGPTVNHAQGYWGFETYITGYGYWKQDGQALGTTVVNPNQANSPIPAGSCVVTAQFANASGSANQPLTITGTETGDILVTVSLSTNKSFEWNESTGLQDGYYQPEIGEYPVDMGIRGMIPKVQ